jgi:predicted anti-sigma-YlaC factor YlaD
VFFGFDRDGGACDIGCYMMHVAGDLTCKEMVELMNDYLEGAMRPEDQADFERHLVFCDGCAEYLHQLRQLGTAAARVREEDLPERTKDALLEAFRRWKRG